MELDEDLFSYRSLKAYQQAKQLVVDVYSLLGLFPKEETFSLCDQLRRAVISVPSNIAEGMGRTSAKEQIRFIEISFGSLYEVMSQIEIAKELGYITVSHLADIETLVCDIAKLLSGLRAKRVRALYSSKQDTPNPITPNPSPHHPITL